ncbi:hypothetical protein [Asticcacaulis excentricus]|nr:hypothetical protein [Asticcacaulis excentricus]
MLRLQPLKAKAPTGNGVTANILKAVETSMANIDFKRLSKGLRQV